MVGNGTAINTSFNLNCQLIFHEHISFASSLTKLGISVNETSIPSGSSGSVAGISPALTHNDQAGLINQRPSHDFHSKVRLNLVA